MHQSDLCSESFELPYILNNVSFYISNVHHINGMFINNWRWDSNIPFYQYSKDYLKQEKNGNIGTNS
jgi:hypothetical protein